MTRETKIGLLVGLAFIIVIGILLSDHLTSSTEPPAATLAQTGSNVRQTIRTPGGTQAPPQPVVAPRGVEPQQPVPTPRELQQPTPATAVVQVGGPSVALQASQQQPTHVDSPVPPITIVGAVPPPQQPASPVQFADPVPAMTDQQVVGADPPVSLVPPSNPVAQIAAQHGEPLVTATPLPQSQQPQQTGPRVVAGSADYVAQPGDSLSRMAGKLMGGNTAANREAIIRANPSLQADPNKVIAGRTYKIPAMPVATAAPVAPLVPQAQPQRRETNSAIEYWYTVKEGDSLWKIAHEQLGKGGSGVAAIKELNKDVLNGSEIVHPNMKLRLPGRPVVSAN